MVGDLRGAASMAASWEEGGLREPAVGFPRHDHALASPHDRVCSLL